MEEIKFKTGDIIRNIKDNTILRVIIVYRGAIGHFYDCEDLRTGEEGKVFNEGEWEVVDDSEKQLYTKAKTDNTQEKPIVVGALVDSYLKGFQVSGDLQEEIKLFLDKTGAPYYWAGDKEQLEWLEFAAHHFAEWGKQQMLKEGIEADVRTDVSIDDDYVYVRAYIKKDKLEEGEKVRLLIIKDN